MEPLLVGAMVCSQTTQAVLDHFKSSINAILCENPSLSYLTALSSHIPDSLAMQVSQSLQGYVAAMLERTAWPYRPLAGAESGTVIAAD
jgi:hypothetical protein